MTNTSNRSKEITTFLEELNRTYYSLNERDLTEVCLFLLIVADRESGLRERAMQCNSTYLFKPDVELFPTKPLSLMNQ